MNKDISMNFVTDIVYTPTNTALFDHLTCPLNKNDQY